MAALRGMWDPSSLTRDGTCSHCFGSRILTTGPATREVPCTLFLGSLCFSKECTKTSNTQKWIVREYTQTAKQEILLGRSAHGKSRKARELKTTDMLCGLQSRVLWWWDSFLGGLWPIILIQGLSWWHTHSSAKMDFNKEDSGRSVGYLASPFDLSWSDLLAPCSLS